eukprot:47340-Rhodomonas_salina.1
MLEYAKEQTLFCACSGTLVNARVQGRGEVGGEKWSAFRFEIGRLTKEETDPARGRGGQGKAGELRARQGGEGERGNREGEGRGGKGGCTDGRERQRKPLSVPHLEQRMCCTIGGMLPPRRLSTCLESPSPTQAQNCASPRHVKAAITVQRSSPGESSVTAPSVEVTWIGAVT